MAAVDEGYTIEGYELTAQLHSTPASTVWLASHDGNKVVLKVLHMTTAAAQREISIMNELKDVKGVPKLFHSFELQSSTVLEIESLPNRRTLQQVGRVAEPKRWLEISLAVSTILSNIHAKNIVHFDISPSNICTSAGSANRDVGETTWIVDFGSSFEATQIPQRTDLIIGTADYMAPECTGRTRGHKGFHSDLYSLGAVLYQLWTGEPPYHYAKTISEKIHYHLKTSPAMPEDMPLPFWKMISTLMSKEKGDRYLSAAGLTEDLKTLLSTLESKGEEFLCKYDFQTRTSDTMPELLFPEKLYQRENDMSVITDVITKHMEQPDSSYLVLLEGESGIGKTSVAGAVRTHVSIELPQVTPVFVTGKYDQYTKAKPYSAVVDALSSLVKQFLGRLAEAEIREWKTALIKSLDGQLSALCSLIPTLSSLLGQHPKSEQANSEETKNRLNTLFGAFLRCLPSPKNCVAIVYIDDVQWADLASLTLLPNLVERTEGKIFWLLSRRTEGDNLEQQETSSPEEPSLDSMLASLSEVATVTRVQLGPLDSEGIAEMLGDMFKWESAVTSKLAEVVHRKTGGIAFFVRSFIQQMYHANIIWLDTTLKLWVFDLKKVEEQLATDNVLKFMAISIREVLPKKTQEMLQTAACIGNTFDLETVAVVENRSQTKTKSALATAIAKEFLVMVGSDRYKFTHDRVYEAFKGLTSPERAAQLHLSIGVHFLSKLNWNGEIETSISPDDAHDVVYQLSQASSVASIHPRVLKLWMFAATAARDSCAYQLGIDICDWGLVFLPESAMWTKQAGKYIVSFHIFLLKAECLWLDKRRPEAESIFSMLLTKADSIDLQGELLKKRSELLTAAMEFDEVFNLGFEFINKNGLNGRNFLLDRNPDPDAISRAYQDLARRADRAGGLQKLPQGGKNLISAVIADMVPALLLNFPNAYSLATAIQADSILNNGLDKYATLAFVFTGHNFARRGDYARALEWGQRGKELAQEEPEQPYSVKALIAHAMLIEWRVSPMHQVSAELVDSYERCLGRGDSHYASYGTYNSLAVDLLIGVELHKVEEKAFKWLEWSQNAKLQWAEGVNLVLVQFLRCLSGRTKRYDSFDDHTFSEDEFVVRFENSLILHFLHFFKSMALYICGEYSKAEASMEQLSKYSHAAAGYPHQAFEPLLESLIYAAQYQGATQEKRKIYMDKMEANLEIVKNLAKHGPQNFVYHTHLLEAEINYNKGSRYGAVAMKHCEKSIDSAIKSGFISFAAVAHEVAARYYARDDIREASRVHLKEAYTLYQRWGATAKCRIMHASDTETFLSLDRGHLPHTAGGSFRPTDSIEHRVAVPHFRPLSNASRRSFALEGRKSTTNLSDDGMEDEITIRAGDRRLLEAVADIIEEGDLDDVIQSIVTLAGREFDADTATFVLNENDRFIVRCKIDFVDLEPEVVCRNEAMNRTKFPADLFSFLARQKEPTILDDVLSPSNTLSVDYFNREGVRSCLGAPLLYKDVFIGMLYLENKQVKHGFIPDRLVVLSMLSMQLVVYLRHAMRKEESKLSNNLLSTVMDCISDPFFVIDDSLTLLRVSDSLGTLFNVQEVSLNGRNISALANGQLKRHKGFMLMLDRAMDLETENESGPEEVESMSETVVGGGALSEVLEIQLTRQIEDLDDTIEKYWKELKCEATPLPGLRKQCLVVIKDLSEIKLAKGNAGWDRVVQQSNIPIFRVNTELKIVKWNSSMAEISSYPASEAMGQNVVELLCGDEFSKEAALEHLNAGLLGIGSPSVHMAFQTKGNKPLTMLQSISPEREGWDLDSHKDRVVGLFCVGQDITAKEQGEGHIKRNMMSALASYIPRCVIDMYSKNPNLQIKGPYTNEVEGAVLFVDITGFTPLTEKLARESADGAERIAHILDSNFESLLPIIFSNGGDIVKFAGDAILAVFRTGNGRDLRRMAGQAVQAAFTMVETMNSGLIATGVSVPIKVGIAAGKMTEAHIGGVKGAYQYMLLGPPLIWMARAESACKQNQIVIARNTWDLIQDFCSGQTERIHEQHDLVMIRSIKERFPPCPFPSPDLPLKIEKQLSGYLPTPVQKYIFESQISWLTELRRITAVFMSIGGLPSLASAEDMPSQEDIDLLQRAFETIQNIMDYYEGLINKFLLDDKGLVVHCAFGMPAMTHSDDTTRAVLAFCSIKSKLTKLGLTCRVGITTGLAFCGSVGTSMRQEYTDYADIVNLAARLMQAAGPGDVYCDIPTVDQTETSAILFEILEPINIKGKSEKVKIAKAAEFYPNRRSYLTTNLQSILEAHKLHQERKRIVGRDKELSVLSKRFNSLVWEKRQMEVICLSGESGIGKTTVLEKAQKVAIEKGVATAWANIQFRDHFVPYRMAGRVIMCAMGLDSATPEERAKVVADEVMKMTNLNYDSHSALTALSFVMDFKMGDLEGAALPRYESSETVSGKDRNVDQEEVLHQCLLSLGISVMASKKMSIFVDRTTKLESRSAALLSELIKQCKDLMLVLTWDDTSMEQPPLPVDNMEIVKLLPLQDKEMKMLLDDRLGKVKVPAAVKDWVIERASGNAVVADSLLLSYLQFRRDGGEFAKGRELFEISSVMRGRIASGIDRLSTSQQVTLKVAAVVAPGAVNYEFSIDILRNVLQATKANINILQDLEKLEEEKFISPVGDGTVTYRFDEVLVQEVSYNMVLFSQRKELHKHVALWYEKVFQYDLSPYVPILAHHWGRANNRLKEMEYLAKANLLGADDVKRWQTRASKIEKGIETLEGQRLTLGKEIAEAIMQVDQPDKAVSTPLTIVSPFLKDKPFQDNRRDVDPTKMVATINREATPSTSNDVLLHLKDVGSWDFNIFAVKRCEDVHPLVSVGLAVFERFPVLHLFPMNKLDSFLRKVESGYPANAYHNSTHAADVLQASCVLLEKSGLRSSIGAEVQFAMLVSAVVHDLGHPGVNNSYLVQTQDKLAMRYNDTSVLENYHLECLFEILKDPACDIFSHLQDDQRRLCRKLIIDNVLATDMARHRLHLLEFQGIVQRGFDPNSVQDVSVVMQMLLKTADINNLGRDLPLYIRWVDILMEEYFEQGDKERIIGLEPIPIMDRNRCNCKDIQVEFLDRVVLPMYDSVVELFPSLKFIADQARKNLKYWIEEVERTPPSSPEWDVMSTASDDSDVVVPQPPTQAKPSISDGRIRRLMGTYKPEENPNLSLAINKVSAVAAMANGVNGAGIGGGELIFPNGQAPNTNGNNGNNNLPMGKSRSSLSERKDSTTGRGSVHPFRTPQPARAPRGLSKMAPAPIANSSIGAVKPPGADNLPTVPFRNMKGQVRK